MNQSLPMASTYEVMRQDGVMVSVPPNFICPITLQIMERPVVTRNGRSYEREAILGWLRNGARCCPLTRQPLAASDLIPNHFLSNRIETWLKINDIPLTAKASEIPEKFVGFAPLPDKKMKKLMKRGHVKFHRRS